MFDCVNTYNCWESEEPERWLKSVEDWSFKSFPKFPERARKFPGLVNGPTIDWFLPWPKEALVAVSQGLLGSSWHAETDESGDDRAVIHHWIN